MTPLALQTPNSAIGANATMGGYYNNTANQNQNKQNWDQNFGFQKQVHNDRMNSSGNKWQDVAFNIATQGAGTYYGYKLAQK